MWQLGSWLLCDSCNGIESEVSVYFSNMSTSQSLQKVRRHLNGFDKWPMTSSYPQETGEQELREIAKAIKEKKDSEKRETTVNMETNSNKFCDTIYDSFLRFITGDDETNEIEGDEVDGRTEDILKPIVKLYFLKILLIDIGISLGDLVTDVAQGLNLIFDNNWNIHWSTFHYGCIVLAFIWIPVIPMLLHVATSKTLK